MPEDASWSPPMAWIDSGTSSTLCDVRCAVTMISLIPPSSDFSLSCAIAGEASSGAASMADAR